MKSRPVLPLCLSGLVLVATACGGNDAGRTVGAADDGLVPVTFAALSVGQVAPLVAAQKEGIFEDHGIDLTIEYVEAAAVIPTLMGGDADFGWLNAPAVLAARTNNVPVKAVTAASVAGKDPTSFPIQVMVASDGGIKAPKDLVGKKVAVDTLFQLPDLGMRAALIDAGLDPEDIEAVEIPFPDMISALESGRVDAILATEPFVTISQQSMGAVSILSASAGQTASTPQSVVLSAESFIDANEELVADFREAMDEAVAYAVKNDVNVRAVIPTFTELDPELAKAIRLAPIDAADDPAGWAFWADVLVKVGALDEKPDTEAAYLAD